MNCNFILQEESNDSKLFLSLLKGLGSSIINVDDAKIDLKGVILKSCFDNPAGILNKLGLHYKDNLMFQILYLFGSFEIIGNPVGLFTNIASGLQDLITKPQEGFVKGPLEGGLGILEGAGSLLKNTSSGLFNSFNKITGSLGTGFVNLTLDEEYIKQRQLMKQQKAKNVEQGI